MIETAPTAPDWTTVPCPLCDGAATRHWRDVPGLPSLGPRRWPLVQCRDCGCVFASPRWAQQEHLYQETFRDETGLRFVGPVEWCLHQLEAWRAPSIERLRAPGAVLDVGCGRGLVLVVLKRRGWRVAGTEVAAGVAGRRQRRRLGVPILRGDFAVLRWRPARFDVVTLWHVLEHVPSPHATLRQARHVLRLDGWLLVSVPNLASWQARCFGARWLHLNLPLHLTHFTPSTLQRLLEAEGFVVARTQHLHVLWMHNLWGWLQGGLDLIVPERQALFLGLQRAWRRHLAAQPWPRRAAWWLWFVVSVVLAVPLAPLCVALMCAEGAARAGGTIVVLARPREVTG